MNGIRIGKLSPYILNAAGQNQNLTLLGCNYSKRQIQINIEVTRNLNFIFTTAAAAAASTNNNNNYYYFYAENIEYYNI